MLHIAVRADASNIIGAGHFMRSLALIKCIKKAFGAENKTLKVTFICADINSYCTTKIVEGEFSLIKITNNYLNAPAWLNLDSQQTEQALSSLDKVHVLIVDSYRIQEPWYSDNIKSLCSKVMVIDDLANRRHYCHYLLDQTLDVKNERYRKLVPNTCQIMVGKPYMLLREEFLHWRNKALLKRNKTKSIKNILVSLGGSDPTAINLTIINAIIIINKHLDLPLTVNLVVPKNSQSADTYKALEKENSWLTVQFDTNDMARLMYYADIAIGASGSSAWERCCLGLPTLAIELADNQALILDRLSSHGAIINLGKSAALTPQKIQQTLVALLNSNTQYLSLSKKAASCCDGKGSLRVLEKLNLSKVYLKPATLDDRDLLFNWQSQASVRKYSRTNHNISFDEHCHWYENTLKNTNRNLFIITEQWLGGTESPVGMLRLDLQGEQYEVSILICPSQQGRGLAKKALDAISIDFKRLPILATVHPENIPSQILFSKAGFKKISKDLFILK